MVEDAILHHQGGSRVDYQGLACAVEAANRKTNHEDRHDAVLQAQRDDQSRIVNLIGSPDDNTRTTTTRTLPSGSSAVPKRPRRMPTTVRTGRRP
jgi:hypothetical protein